MYTIRIDGPGLKLERELDEQAVVRIVGLLIGQPPGPRSVSVADSAGSPGNLALLPAESPREYIDRLKARTNLAKIVAFGLIVCSTRQVDSFSAAEIKSLFISAAEPLPRNLSRDFRSTLQAKWIAAFPDREEAYYVTATGREAAATGFPAPAGSRGSIYTTSRHRPGAAGSVSESNGATRRKSKGATGLLAGLYEAGFFNEPRTTQDILTKLLEGGHSVARTDLTQPLLSLVQARPPKLVRKKQPTSSGRPVWAYSSPK